MTKDTEHLFMGMMTVLIPSFLNIFLYLFIFTLQYWFDFCHAST